MTCEVRNNNTEVVLRDVKVGDVLALARLIIQKDKEVVFTRPQESDNDTD